MWLMQQAVNSKYYSINAQHKRLVAFIYEFIYYKELTSYFQQFMAVLGSYFLSDSKKNKALRYFISQGTYDFCIEADTGTIQLNEWSQVQAGRKIIMRVIFEQTVDYEEDECQCPRPTCRAWNNKRVSQNGWIVW